MFASLSRSWEYTKLSLSVLNKNRHLIIFPILSGIASLLVMASFFFPLWQTGLLAEWTSDTDATLGDAVFYVTVFSFYLLNYFVIIFFNCALIFAVIRYLQGEQITLKFAIQDALSVIHQIFGWAFLSAVFGLLLNALERNQKVGRLVTSLLGSAWTALTYFVLPVIVVERIGPVPAVKRSIGILKNEWGTALMGNFSLGFIGFLLMLPVFLVAAAVAYLGFQTGTTVGMVFGFGLGGMLMICGLAADAALGHIFRAILYCHATGNTLPPEINQRELGAAFTNRQ